MPPDAGAHAPMFVLMSLIVAVLGSWTALDLFRRVKETAGAVSMLWLAAAAVATGLSIWSMHFTAMLAFSLPIPLTYDAPIVLLSLLVAMLASGFALFVVSRESVSLER